LSEPLQEGWAEAFAPASVGNVAVGFDLMGHALAGLGDRVRVRLIDEAAVRVRAITGVVTELPQDSTRNTAGAALEAMRLKLGLERGFGGGSQCALG
jgi:homoserine kinase